MAKSPYRLLTLQRAIGSGANSYLLTYQKKSVTKKMLLTKISDKKLKRMKPEDEGILKLAATFKSKFGFELVD